MHFCTKYLHCGQWCNGKLFNLSIFEYLKIECDILRLVDDDRILVDPTSGLHLYMKRLQDPDKTLNSMKFFIYSEKAS